MWCSSNQEYAKDIKKTVVGNKNDVRQMDAEWRSERAINDHAITKKGQFECSPGWENATVRRMAEVLNLFRRGIAHSH